MHKDCIVLCENFDETQPSNTTCLEPFRASNKLILLSQQLQKIHICKVVFVQSVQNKIIEEFVLQNRSLFPFAYDFIAIDENIGSGTAIMEALAYTDTTDILIIQANNYFPIDLDKLFAWQQNKEADVSLALKYNKNEKGYFASLNEESKVFEPIKFCEQEKEGLELTGYYCLFRTSFLNIDFPKQFSFEKDYLMKYYHERDFIGCIFEDDFNK